MSRGKSMKKSGWKNRDRAYQAGQAEKARVNRTKRFIQVWADAVAGR